jgi:dipeptidyl aminopeptidase/acylaminoacyl peptidase
VGCLLLSLAPCVASAAQAAPRALVPEDFYRILNVRDPQLSPDGQWVAYVVSANDRAADEPRSALWMVSWDGTAHLQLTYGLKDADSPRWSPDGKLLAFLATPAGAEQATLMVLDRRGGEPRGVAKLSGSVASYEWAPDGKRLVVAMDGAGEAKAPVAGAAPKVPAPIVIKSARFKHDISGYVAASDAQRLSLIDLESPHVEALSAESHYYEDGAAWSPDGKTIAYIRTREQAPDADGMEDIMLIEAHAGATPRLLKRVYAPNAQRLAWSPDGTRLAYLEGSEPKYSAYMSDRLMIASPGDGSVRAVSPALDRAIVNYGFVSDGQGFLAVIEDDQVRYPAHIALATGAIERLLTAPLAISGFSTAGARAALAVGTDQYAPEIHALEGSKIRKLTTHNDALLAEVALGAVEDLAFKSRDGTEIHGLMVKPANYVAGRNYPTVLWIHGGPNGQDEHALPFDHYPLQFERQLLAAQGYVVIGINYRGSSGRGVAFQKSIYADWCHKEVDDLRAGIDHLIARGIADPARLGIGGWSYGGILTDCTIASDTRFRAAVSGAGSANQLSMFGSDQYANQYLNEIGAPWKNLPLWLKVSYAFFHADRIRTPTLFLGGEKDFNVPISGGEQMYQALRTLNVPAELVVYPEQFHIFVRPSYIVDRAHRVQDWYAKYLQPVQGNAQLPGN